MTMICGYDLDRVGRLRQRVRAGLEAAATEAAEGQPEAGEDLLAWGRRLLPDHFRAPPSAMHRWLARQLADWPRRRGRRLNVLGPRGSAKSTLVTLAYVLRCAATGSEPYIWLVSDTRHQACAHLDNLRTELTENLGLQAAYPRTLRLRWCRQNRLVLAGGVAIEAFGTGQRIRGRRRRADRPTLIIGDDLQNDRHIESARARDLSRRWFHGLLMNAGSPQTNVIHLATALHPEALGPELHATPGWTSRVFRSIQRWPARMELWSQWEAIYADLTQSDSAGRAAEFYQQHRRAMHQGCRLLWPQREDLYTLMRQRVEGGATAFEREKQNNPLNPEQCEWPESYFGDFLWFDAWPRAVQVRAMALDPSQGGDSRRGDFAAYVMLAVGADGQLYVEADLARRRTDQMVAVGVDWVRRFRPDVFGVEANQFQQLLAEQFALEFARQSMPAAAVWTIDNRVNKAVRIRRLGPLLAGRRLRFFASSTGTRLLVEQLRQFPAGDHDDGPDALEMAVRLAADWLGRRETIDDGLGDRLI